MMSLDTEEKVSRPGGRSYLPALLIGLAAALLLMLILSLAAAAAVYFSPLDEGVLGKAALAVDGLAAFGGGFTAARSSGRRGLPLGAAVGLLLLLLTLPLGAAGWYAPAGKAAVCLLPALAGGVLGVR
ncbi:MAG: TIGR04086 family membrane protein [Firmicutes bacterium]|nr:TIGR04086 family membrane protein [Bacillota bacterium]